MKIENITTETVRVDGRTLSHDDIVRWAKSDATWAVAARDIAAAIRDAEQAAYIAYTRRSVVSGGTVAGLGTMSIGPDRDLQARYMGLAEVLRKYAS